MPLARWRNSYPILCSLKKLLLLHDRKIDHIKVCNAGGILNPLIRQCKQTAHMGLKTVFTKLNFSPNFVFPGSFWEQSRRSRWITIWTVRTNWYQGSRPATARRWGWGGHAEHSGSLFPAGGRKPVPWKQVPGDQEGLSHSSLPHQHIPIQLASKWSKYELQSSKVNASSEMEWELFPALL